MGDLWVNWSITQEGLCPLQINSKAYIQLVGSVNFKQASTKVKRPRRKGRVENDLAYGMFRL